MNQIKLEKIGKKVNFNKTKSALMQFFRWVFVFSLVFFTSCKGDKTTVHLERNQTEAESAPNEMEALQILEENKGEAEPEVSAEASEEVVTEADEIVSETDESQAISSEVYKCNASNYQDYFYDFQKVDQLIADTGTGCYLPGIDFSNQDLSDAVFTKANLKGAIFRGANLDGTKFIGADLTNAVLEDTNYQNAYFRSAVLTGTRYNEYDTITAWTKVISGQGIRNPEAKGMVYTGQ